MKAKRLKCDARSGFRQIKLFRVQFFQIFFSCCASLIYIVSIYQTLCSAENELASSESFFISPTHLVEFVFLFLIISNSGIFPPFLSLYFILFFALLSLHFYAQMVLLKINFFTLDKKSSRIWQVRSLNNN